jgi:hypothetical protein
MDKNIIYVFLGGLYAGRFTNMFSNTLITGLALYFCEPNFYSYSNFNNIKETLTKLLK